MYQSLEFLCAHRSAVSSEVYLLLKQNKSSDVFIIFCITIERLNENWR